MSHRVAVVPGDGIGPEVVRGARAVLDATGVGIRWDETRPGQPQAEVIAAIRSARVALKGPTESPPPGTNGRSLHVAIRQELDLYANLRPATTFPGVPGAIDGTDLVVVRENTEDLYSGRDADVVPDQRAEATKVITRKATERIFRFAFEYARAHRRRKVTMVHKADLLKATDGLFARVGREVAQRYPDLSFEERLVDNLCVELVRRPRDFDILVLPNQYGDIVSGLAAGLVGGLGILAGANHGDGIAVFEPTHGVAKKYAGQNRVNPTAAILSGAMLLRHLGEEAAAARVEAAVRKVIQEGTAVTYDLRPHRDDPAAVGTTRMVQAILNSMT